jgi:hypothetical protein
MKPFIIYFIKRLIFAIIAAIIMSYIIIQINDYNIEETSKAFKNSESLVCYDTLIVTNSNWKLVDNHLINNNFAGYLLIDNCGIKKD